MTIKESILNAMTNEVVNFVAKLEKVGMAKEYNGIVYTDASNLAYQPICLILRSKQGLWRYNLVGFIDEENEQIVVGNINENGQPQFMSIDEFQNGVYSLYTQLCEISTKGANL